MTLVQALQARKLRIDGIGNQAHWRLETPTIDEIATSLAELHATGLKVMAQRARHQSPAEHATRRRSFGLAYWYPNELPEALQQQLARRYADVFGVFLKDRHAVTRVTFWGLSDADSWLNRGRMNYPLLWIVSVGPSRRSTLSSTC